MGDDIEEEVWKFVSEFWHEPLQRLRPNTRLEEDLGMTGDDAWEFMEEFGKRFHVDMAAFDPIKHFGPEGCNPLWLFYTPAWMAEHGRYPVTVDHLVRVAQAKRWFSPPCVR